MPEAAVMTDRRAHFRALMARLDGSGNPQTALTDGLYLPRPDGVAERIAKSLEIRPNGSHLVVGTIGSGKTTALLRVKALLAESAPECHVRYEDAAEWAVPRDRVLLTILADTAGLRTKADPTVLLVDGLDRTSDLDAFRELVREALPSFEKEGIGLVCVGPPLLQAEPPSFESEWFDNVHICGAVEVWGPGRDFLTDLIAKRAGEVITTGALDLLVDSSGGIVRDLLLLSRQALEDTYIDGGDLIDRSYVHAAIRRLGRSMLRSATEEQLNSLKGQVERDGHYSGPPPAGRLIVDRLLVPTAGVPMRLYLHPCVLAVLQGQV